MDLIGLFDREYLKISVSYTGFQSIAIDNSRYRSFQSYVVSDYSQVVSKAQGDIDEKSQNFIRTDTYGLNQHVVKEEKGISHGFWREQQKITHIFEVNQEFKMRIPGLLLKKIAHPQIFELKVQLSDMAGEMVDGVYTFDMKAYIDKQWPGHKWKKGEEPKLMLHVKKVEHADYWIDKKLEEKLNTITNLTELRTMYDSITEKTKIYSDVSYSIDLSLANIYKMDRLGHADPYLKIFYKCKDDKHPIDQFHPSTGFVKTRSHNSVMNCIFTDINIQMDPNSDLIHQPVLIEVWDQNALKDKLIGKIEIPLIELIHSPKDKEIVIACDDKKVLKKQKNPKQMSLWCTKYRFTESSVEADNPRRSQIMKRIWQIRHEMVDTLKKDCKINVTFAVNFAKSNGKQSSPYSLHTGTNENQYVKSINSVLDAFKTFKVDTINVFGYGANVDGTTLPMFDLKEKKNMLEKGNSSRTDYKCGDDVISAYKDCLQSVKLDTLKFLKSNRGVHYQPDDFHQVLDKMVEELQEQKDQVYKLFVVLTNSDIISYAETVRSILKATDESLSILVLQIGGNQSLVNLPKLDADNGKLVDPEASNLVQTQQRKKRDIVQNIKFATYMNTQHSFEQRIFAEFNEQFTTYFEHLISKQSKSKSS